MQILRHYWGNTFASLSIRNYRLYFIGQAVSLSGTWLQQIAQGLLVLKLTDSGTVLGIITALQFLPILLFGPLGGVIADRFPKRKILFFTQSAAGILALILSLLVALNIVQIWMIGVLSFSLGLVNLIDNPTRQTFVPELVGKEKMVNAVTLNSWEVNLARIIGPSIAGILVLTVGFALCFFINGISYIAVIIVLNLMDSHYFHLAQSKRGSAKLKDGLKYVVSTPKIRNTLIILAIVGTLTYEFQVILPLVAQFTFHNAVAGYAELTTAMGFGAVIGGLFSAGRKSTSTKMLLTVLVLFGLSDIFAALAPSFTVALIAMVLVGAASLNFNSMGNVTLQMASLPEMRGRVMSLWTMAFLGSTPIGGPIIGWIGENISPRWGLGVGGLAALIAAFIGLLTIGKMQENVISEDMVVEDKRTQIPEMPKIP